MTALCLLVWSLDVNLCGGWWHWPSDSLIYATWKWIWGRPTVFNSDFSFECFNQVLYYAWNSRCIEPYIYFPVRVHLPCSELSAASFHWGIYPVHTPRVWTLLEGRYGHNKGFWGPWCNIALALFIKLILVECLCIGLAVAVLPWGPCHLSPHLNGVVLKDDELCDLWWASNGIETVSDGGLSESKIDRGFTIVWIFPQRGLVPLLPL